MQCHSVESLCRGSRGSWSAGLELDILDYIGMATNLPGSSLFDLQTQYHDKSKKLAKKGLLLSGGDTEEHWATVLSQFNGKVGWSWKYSTLLSALEVQWHNANNVEFVPMGIINLLILMSVATD